MMETVELEYCDPLAMVPMIAGHPDTWRRCFVAKHSRAHQAAQGHPAYWDLRRFYRFPQNNY